MRRVLELASNRLIYNRKLPYVYPYWVQVSVDQSPVKVFFSEGDAHGAHGGVFTLEEALTEKWASHFVNAEGEWILPYLERLARGETVTELQLIADFERRHGRSPIVTNWSDS